MRLFQSQGAILRCLQQKNDPCRMFRQSSNGFTTTSQGRKKATQAIDSKYSQEESERILHHFNQSTPDQLRISKLLNIQKATAIYKYRQLNGSFRAIGDVLNVNGVGISGLEKYCDVIKSADHLAQLKLLQEEDLKAFSPNLSTQELEKIENIITLDLQFDRVTWVKLGRDCQLKDWSHVFIFDKQYQRFDHPVYMEKLMELVQSIPKGDVFVMENKIFRITTLKVVPLAISFRVLEAMLMTILNLSLKKKVVTCKPNTIGRNFDLTVGGERVSGINIVKDLLQGKSNEIGCNVPQELKGVFYSADHMQQEYYTNCLLLASTYHKLVLSKVTSV